MGRRVGVMVVLLGLLVCVAALPGSARQRDAWEYQIAYDVSVGTLNKLGAVHAAS